MCYIFQFELPTFQIQQIFYSLSIKYIYIYIYFFFYIFVEKALSLSLLYIYIFFEKNPLKGRDLIIVSSINQVGTPQECLVEQTPSRPKKDNWQLA